MAHPQQICFIEIVSQHLSPNGFPDKRILEIGSYDVNGSIRSLFTSSHYVGVDLIEGPGVDLVCEGDKLQEPAENYDVVISCECFEHNPNWFETFVNMHRMTKPGGIVIFTCATTGRLEHGTTRTDPSNSPGTQGIGWNYYRNLKESDFTRKISFGSLFDTYLFISNRSSKDLYFVGQKKGSYGIFHFNTQEIRTKYTGALRQLEASINKTHPYPKFLRFLSSLTLLPVNIASLLPEKYFQNFSVPYSKFDDAVKIWALKTILKKGPRENRNS